MIDLYRCLSCHKVFTRIRNHPMPPEEGDGFDNEINGEWFDHRDHHLELLRPLKETAVSREPYEASRRTVYFLATNGQDNFLIKKRKTRGNDACQYELKKGLIRQFPPSINLREEDLLKQIVWEKEETHPTAEDISVFVFIIKDALARIKWYEIGDVVADFHHPLISYGILPEKFFQEVLEHCRQSFSSLTALWFVDFIKKHKKGHLPLGVELRRDFEIIEIPREEPVVLMKKPQRSAS